MAQGANDLDKNSYNINSSQTAQQNFNAVATAVETALDQQTAAVNQLMAQYQADGVSEQHRHNEGKFKTNAEEVRNVIRAIRSSLEKSDGHAQSALSTAATATDI